MATKTCLDCGTALTAWNHNWGSQQCNDCARVPLSQSKVFFERIHPIEKDIQDYPVASFIGKMIGYAAILLVVITLAAMIGYSNARSFGGLAYGFLGGLGTIFVFRKWVVARNSVHPLDTRRWYHFAFVYSVLVVCFWLFAYMGIMPSINSPVGGSLFSFHILITRGFTMPAFWLVTLIATSAGLLGVLVGYINILRSDKKDKAITITHYQRWKQAGD